MQNPIDPTEKLVLQFDPIIKSIANKSVWDTHLLQDAIQEGRLAVILAAKAYRPESSTDFFGFITKQIRFRILDYLRIQHRYEKRIDPINSAKHHSSLDHRRLEEQLIRVSILRQIRRLPTNQRRILELIMTENLTQSEIARRLGLSQKTICVLLHKGIKRLRERFAVISECN